MTIVIASDQTLGDRWTDWLATAAPRRLAPATISEYRRQLRFFREWMGATLDVVFTTESTTPYRVRQYLAHLETKVQRHERHSATYNKALAALASFGAWLVTTGGATTNPAAGLRSIPEQPGPVKALGRKVILKLLDAAHHTGDLRDALVIELLAHSGMRASEVASLQASASASVGVRRGARSHSSATLAGRASTSMLRAVIPKLLGLNL